MPIYSEFLTLSSIWCLLNFFFFCFRLRHRPYKVWGDIRWKEILKEFPEGFTHLFLYRICAKIFDKYPGYRKDPIQDVIEYGLRKTKSMRNKRLKTLVLNENKELEVIKYEDKLRT